ncbi:MAG: branched-chain amino acid aminotransferase [Christensenellaceae bacterium]|nr:branched-chain amino acid aminotransferase [Christensenellaceae bacterium]
MKITKINIKKEKPDFSKLGFGKYFTDHMLVTDYANGKWSELQIVPYDRFSVAPCMASLHYGQGIFEGLKAYKTDNGTTTLFRPLDNLERMNRSAQRLCMPQIDVKIVSDGIKELLKIDEDWIPSLPGTSLYIRPTMIATEEVLGVHPSKSYKFFVILSPVGSYYANGLAPTKILVEQEYVRAPIGGTGATKCMGNYAASLLAGEKANRKGYDQALWLDVDHKYVEEVGAMNIFFVIDGIVKTPALVGSILPGITRDSVLKLLKKNGIPAEETRILISEVYDAYRAGTLTEAFGSGTAAVISPVGVLGYRGEDLIINKNKIGPISKQLYDELTGIQYARIKDEFGWVQYLK